MTDWNKYLAKISFSIGLFIVLLVVVLHQVQADEMTHKFKNPSFSGVGTSSHYLTIENQEFNRKEAIREEIQAYVEELEREADNTTLARFIRNLESRIYAQLSRQLVDSLFGETASDFGTLELEGNTIEYRVEDDKVTLIITDEEGNTTEITVPLGSLLSSCALIVDPLDNGIPPIRSIDSAEVGILLTKLSEAPIPIRKPVVAVYPNSFKDDTGQRRSNSQYASFSTAITQAPDAYLIRALQHSNVFDVVERKGLDNLTKERQIIRTTRESFDEKQKVKPLLFAGLLMEGGVVGYETNIKSGGAGARYLGIGASKEYRQDSVTISLRTVSVSTGKILFEVLVTKSILSASVSNDIFRFYANNTELVEIESGIVENESVNIALQMAIETAVLQTIEEGYKEGYWKQRKVEE